MDSVELTVAETTTMTIFPDAPEVKEVAKLLLELADNPRDVSTTLDPTIGFVVPQWLYELFVEVWASRLAPLDRTVVDSMIVELKADASVPADQVAHLEKFQASLKLADEAVEAAPETPARRKPGRPRKEDK